MASETLTITKSDDGTFQIKEDEPAGEATSGDAPIDQNASSPDEVLQLVQQWLSEEASEPPDAGDAGDPSASAGAPPDPAAMKAAWNQEASSRDASGYRK